jgi:hypothetical protein
VTLDHPKNAKTVSIFLFARASFPKRISFFSFSESAQKQGGYVFPELLATFRQTPLLAIHRTVIRQRLARAFGRKSLYVRNPVFKPRNRQESRRGRPEELCQRFKGHRH